MVDHPSGKQKTLWEAGRPPGPGGACSASAAAPPVPTRVPRRCFHLGEAGQARTRSLGASDAKHPRSRPRRRVSPPRVPPPASPRRSGAPGVTRIVPRGATVPAERCPRAAQRPSRAPGAPGDCSSPGRSLSGPWPRCRPPLRPGSPGTPSPARPEPRSPPGCAGQRRDAAAHCCGAAEDVKEHPDGGIKQELLCVQRDRLHSGNY
ncbi:WW domain-binding protein 11-like [Motacilla alba alba]|uniref:WW domain-binding protein 11-like n=1 Tax=Motacilla alba alba TaxID=1094192 RepID=UPI0018D5A0A4|nr:WW domain-binding protein 11-like [Motacilla alba alba]XP_037995635.1 WW domain-binding protein 11-like [Motacilla alba alba]